MVRDAFLCDEVVRIDCKGLPKSDYKRLGCKLRVMHSFQLKFGSGFGFQFIVIERLCAYESCILCL